MAPVEVAEAPVAPAPERSAEEPHVPPEERLAELKGTEACVLFGSGFLANTGVIAALATDTLVAASPAVRELR